MSRGGQVIGGDHVRANAACRSGRRRSLRWRPVAAIMTSAWLVAQSGAALPGALLGEETSRPYRIVDGKVDKRTYNGFRRYNSVCNHCHGPDGAGGSFAHSLVEAPMTIEDFRIAVLAGRVNGIAVMQGFANDPNVAPYVDDLYAYLRARADGVLGRGRPAVAAEP